MRGVFKHSTADLYASRGAWQRRRDRLADDAFPAIDEATIDRAAAAWTGLPSARREGPSKGRSRTAANSHGAAPLQNSWPMVSVLLMATSRGRAITHEPHPFLVISPTPRMLYFRHCEAPAEWFHSSVFVARRTVAALMASSRRLGYSPHTRYPYEALPQAFHSGMKRWHMIIGLFFGVVTTTWALSGLLSMGPFSIMNRLTELTVRSEPPPTEGTVDAVVRGEAPDMTDALRGSGEFSLATYSAKPASTAIASLGDFEVKEVEYTSLGGTGFYLASNGSRETRVVPVTGAKPHSDRRGRARRTRSGGRAGN